MNVIGGLTTGLEIWNLAVLPYLLGNAECWMEIPKKAINVLNSIQNDFLRSLFQTGNGTPISALYWDTGSLMIENQIMQRKLLFLYHLMTLPENSLAKEIYLIQKENALPGLVNECEQFLSDLNIHADPSTFTKGQWKKIIRKKIQDRNKQLLLQQIREYKKLDYEEIVNEDYGLHDYLKTMTVTQARVYFSVRTQMLPTVQCNFRNKPEYIANQHKCLCGEEDVQSHLHYCVLYSHCREGLNMAKPADLVTFFQRVIGEREREEDRRRDRERER